MPVGDVGFDPDGVGRSDGDRVSDLDDEGFHDNRASTYTKRFPKLVIEIPSDSTESCDRGDKFADYRALV